MQGITGVSRYRVAFVGEADLPRDQDFAFVECEGVLWLAMKRTRVCEHALEEAWSIFRQSA